MSTIEDTNKVDAIGIDKETGVVILKIFDHLIWDDEQKHLYLLQEKINSYLRFMESEDVLDAYPDARNRKLNISISFKEKPTANGIKFLDTVSKIVADAGFSLTYSIANI
ncbi:MAG: hypothetical protein NTX45_24855 [Proteobacteria bacterium]|nr:hypothetical protein [Pseudomonadota bacterium]